MGVRIGGGVGVSALASGPLAIEAGGTGQITAPLAINALLPTQIGSTGLFLTTNGTNVSWATSGISGVVPITQGGTGQITAPLAINALLPTQTGQTGKVLGTNGTVASWIDSGSSVTGIIVSRAYLNTATSTTTAGWQKVPVDTIAYDPNGVFNVTTKRFTPTRAGYYLCDIRARTSTTGQLTIAIGKNGSSTNGFTIGGDAPSVNAEGGSGLMFCNGTTDYLEPYIFASTVRAYTVGNFDTYMEIIGPLNVTGAAGTVQLNSTNVYTMAQAVTPAPLVSAATVNIDASLSNNFKLLLNINATLANPTGLMDGQIINIRITQDAVGNRTLLYGTKYKFAGGEFPTLSTAPNAVDLLCCVYYADLDILLCQLNRSFG